MNVEITELKETIETKDKDNQALNDRVTKTEVIQEASRQASFRTSEPSSPTMRNKMGKMMSFKVKEAFKDIPMEDEHSSESCGELSDHRPEKK